MHVLSPEEQRYHREQYDKAYESTAALASFIRSEVRRREEPPMLTGRVLDVGCGAGANIHWLDEWNITRRAEVVGIDQDAELLVTAKERNPTRDFACLDFRDPLPKCDYALSIQVLSFIEDWRPALRELLHALASGGMLFASSLFWTGVDTHTHASDGEKRNAHYNVISREEFVLTCKRDGGEVVRWHPFYAQNPLYGAPRQLRSRTWANLTLSGPLYLPWTFVAVRKT